MHNLLIILISALKKVTNNKIIFKEIKLLFMIVLVSMHKI